MSDNHYYGCCAAIGAAGIGLVPKLQFLTSRSGFTVNLYINSSVETKTPDGETVVFETDTEYPKNGAVKIRVKTQKPSEFELLLRNPCWSKKTKVWVCGKNIAAEPGYIKISRLWLDNDEVEILFDMRTEAIYPTPYGHQILMNKVIWGHNYMVSTYDKEDPIAKNHIALRRGPVMLAQENRLGYSVDEPVSIEVDKNGYVNAISAAKKKAPYPNIIEVCVPLCSGGEIHLTDYASAGKLWNEKSKMAVWILTNQPQI